MPDKMIKKVSRQLNHGNYLRSFSIIISKIPFVSFFCILPWVITLIYNKSGLRVILQNNNPILSTVIIPVACIITLLLACQLKSAFSIGENAWYTGRMTRKKLCGKRLRFWFAPSHSFKALKLKTVLFILKAIWTIVLTAPALLIFSVIIATAVTGGIEFYMFVSLIIGGLALLIIGLVFRFIVIQRYYLAPYLLANNPRLSVMQVIKQSKNLLDGHLFRVVKFKLKFVPQFLLYPLIFPAVFLHPHYKQSCSVLAKEICL